MAAKPRTGVEWHVSERLRLCRVDHFPNVDAHGLVHDLELVDECNIHRTEDIFRELHRFSDLGARHRHGLGYEGGVESLCERQGRRTIASDHSWNGRRREFAVSGILALGAVSQEEILPAL